MTEPLDLTECDREPIHIPGSIQPHGVLFTIEPTDFTVLQFAGTWRGWDSRDQPELRGIRLAEVLSEEAASRVASADLRGKGEPVYIGSFAFGESGVTYDLTAHISGAVIVVELEPSETVHKSAPELLAAIRAIISEFEAAADLAELCALAARMFRDITKFDRVMVYRFYDDGVGYVAAEEKRDDLPSFLNHHYPASDIPSQARALYVRNRIRTIADVDYQPSPVHPASPGDAESLDMSDSVLRSVSPIHIEYLKNMDVAASASVSIVVGGKLWGLIALHHLTPKLLGYELREASKHLGQVLAQHIRAREESEARMQAAALATQRDELSKILTRAASIDETLREQVDAIAKIVPCDGAAVACGDRIAISGSTPSVAHVSQLADWLLAETDLPMPFATDRLSQTAGYPLEPLEEAAGLLASTVSTDDRVVLLWFRAEQIQKINWAGNPHKAVQEDTGRLSPASRSTSGQRSYAIGPIPGRKRRKTRRGGSAVWSMD